MLLDRVSNPGPLTYESDALPIALGGPARSLFWRWLVTLTILFLNEPSGWMNCHFTSFYNISVVSG